MKINQLHNILSPRSIWAMEPLFAQGYYPIITNILKGKNLGLATEKEFATLTFINAGGKRISIQSNESVSNETGVQNAVLVIPVIGAITKYDQDCGPMGTETMAQWVNWASSNEKISAIVFDVNSGGGEGYACMNLSSAIKNCKKPTIASISGGMAASAAYWISSECDEVYCAHENDAVGSIGTYVTLADWNTYLTKEGLPIHEIYAPASSEKNIEFKEALKGNYKPLQDNVLSPFNETFLSNVKANRPNSDVNAWNKGKLFFAADALKIGLIDGMKTFDECVARAQEMSKSNQKSEVNTNSKIHNNMKVSLTSGLAALTKFFSKKEGEEIELSADDIQKLNNEIATLDGVKAELSTAKTSVETLTASLAAANAKVTELEAKVTTLGAAHPGVGNQPVAKNQVEVTTNSPKQLRSWEKNAVEQREKLNSKKN